MPPPTFLLQGMETLENDTFPVGETVTDVWEIITRVPGRHLSVSSCRHAEATATMACTPVTP
jgi:hypothetical protein